MPVPASTEGDEDPTEASVPASPPADDGSGIGSDDFAAAEPSPNAEEAPEWSSDRPETQPPTAAGPAEEAGGQQVEIVIEGGGPLAAASPEELSSEQPLLEETPVQEVTIVREPETGATAEAAPAERSNGSVPPEEGAEPPEGEPPSEPPVGQAPTEPAPPGEDAPAPAFDPGDEADGHSGSDTARTTGQDGPQTTHQPPAGGAGDPTDHAHPAGTQPPSEEGAPPPTPTADGHSKAADQPGDEAKDPANEPGAGGQEQPADDAGTRGGDPREEVPRREASQGDTPQARAGTHDDPAGDDPLPRRRPDAEDTRDPRRHNHGASDPREPGNGRPADPTARMGRAKEADGGGGAVQERARDAVELPEGGGTPSPAAREAEPEAVVASRPYQHGGSRRAPQGTDLRMLQNPLGPARRGGSEPNRAPRGTGDSQWTPAGTGREDAQEGIRQGSPELGYVVRGVGGEPTSRGIAASPDTPPGPAAARSRAAAELARQERVAARRAAEAQTYTQPAPAVGRRPEPVYQESAQQIASEPLDPASQVPRQRLEPPQVQQPVRRAVPAAAPSQPVQPVLQGAGVQAARLTRTVDQAVGR